MKKSVYIMLLSCVLITSCSNNINNIKPNKDDFTSSETSSTTPDHAFVNKEMSDKLNSYGEDTSDKWFIHNLLESGVDIDKDTVLEDRESICTAIKDGKNAQDIRVMFSQFNEEQVGVLIASSMISHCPDDPIIM